MKTDVEIKKTVKKGKGVFALKNFCKGKVIFINKRGKLVKEKNFTKISKIEGDHLNEIDETTWEIMNPPGRFINHSCNPNAVPKEYSKRKVPYIALKSIREGEEITVDYRINAHTGNTWRCSCGGKSCLGKVTSDFFTLSEILQRKYLFYTSKFIKNEYEKRHKNSRTQKII